VKTRAVDPEPILSMTDAQLAAHLTHLKKKQQDLLSLLDRYSGLLREPLVTAPTRERLNAHRADTMAHARILELTTRAADYEQRRRLVAAGVHPETGRAAPSTCGRSCHDWTDEETEPGTEPGELSWRSRGTSASSAR
jgi:hypothetical protein